MNTDTIIQIAVALFPVLVICYLILAVRRLRNKARIAENAGLASSSRTVQETSEIMIIGSTGHSLFDAGDGLCETLRRCRAGKIMLLDPREYGAILRAQSRSDPETTREAIYEQVRRSIERIKALREGNKTVRLKLYPDMPLFKLAIFGDHVRVRHYHTSMDVFSTPEYLFRNQLPHGGLYAAFYRYFQSRWLDPDIPEYDLTSDELVYRDELGYEVLREKFNGNVQGIDFSGGPSPWLPELRPEVESASPRTWNRSVASKQFREVPTSPDAGGGAPEKGGRLFPGKGAVIPRPR